MKTKYDIHKAAGIIIRDRKLLVSREKNKHIFTSPGGKVEQNELPVRTLLRELLEELSLTISESDVEYFDKFIHPAAGKDNKIIFMEVYMINKYSGDIIPDHDIEEIKWIDSNLQDDIEIGSIFKEEIIPRLKQMDLID